MRTTPPKDAQKAARRIGIEKSVLIGWGNHFEIDRRGEQSEKLKEYLRNGQLEGTLDALDAIFETFSSVQLMKKRYGLEFRHRGGRDRVGHRFSDRTL